MTIKFKTGCKQRLKKVTGTSSPMVERVIERIQVAVPHLTFEPWNVKKSNDESGAFDTTPERRRLRITFTAGGLCFEGHCCKDEGTVVSSDDHEYLNQLSLEAKTFLTQVSNAENSLFDFGSIAVSKTLQKELKVQKSPVALFQFLRGISQQTYENQRISYGVIISPKEKTPPVQELLVTAADNKRFKHLSDGYSTAFLLDGNGYLVGLEPLPFADNKGKPARRRPSWLSNLAEKAVKHGGVGIGLTRSGDILVAMNGKLAFSQRAGIWKRWDHEAIINKLKRVGKFQGKPHDFSSVLTFLYQVSLDLSFRRSGGLFVVLSNDKHKLKLLSQKERMRSQSKAPIDRALDFWLGNRKLHYWERQLVADIASLDGATVIDRNGNLISYGQILRISNVGGAGEQGARTRAARAGSKHGVAIKISADGDISFYAGGEKKFEI
jgi:DisA bacterial checkpoint controller nucleotide-binding.